MAIEDELKIISAKIDKYHEEDIKRAYKNKKDNIGYISTGFALAGLGLAFTYHTYQALIFELVTASGVFVLLINAIVSFIKAGKVKIN